MPTLAEHFPSLEFAREADRWLETVSQSTLHQQLQERRVRRIRIEPMLFSGALGIQDGDFVMFFNDMSTPEEDAHALGHEIGHTFHFDLTKTPPEVTIPDKNAMSDDLFDLVENFCNAFAEKWLAVNGGESIEKRCRNERRCLSSISTTY